MSYELVWFKRDLRIQDHAALAEAARRGPVRLFTLLSPSCGGNPIHPCSILSLFKNPSKTYMMT